MEGYIITINLYDVNSFDGNLLFRKQHKLQKVYQTIQEAQEDAIDLAGRIDRNKAADDLTFISVEDRKGNIYHTYPPMPA
jgi:aspartyl/asparaginyl-tRNA synthetase